MSSIILAKSYEQTGLEFTHMARERYLLNDTEDTIHQNQIKPTTGKQKGRTGGFTTRCT